MKINPNEQMLQGAAVSGPKPKAENISTSFADILSKTAQTNAPKQVAAPLIIQPIVRAPLSSPHEVYQSTERMLDAMANYQNLLGNQKSTLREIEPAVDDLKKEAFALEPLLQGMDEKDPVAQIAREAMIIVNKEITRFEAGVYVDGD